ncbi:beta strand repeat-containing protein [Rhizobium oryzicola]|uniref:DUF4214 domain-containing protein n=1 Tax=Rhizobium oryzicola TaxID=1232668 RepID=A0ABT8T1S1_9HYPH|nr:DUF4214 domain-containing protein [Rhizobium oryzicola]MDO1584591.1 DUF4214 domain-containing protein [Rhizobium oryzicola]
MATIQGVYVALFGRPADPTGLAYFNSVTNNGANLNAISNLAGTAEYQTRFAGLSNPQIINSIYQSLFGRDADLAGLTFFANGLASGKYNINNIAITILDGAQGTDLTTVTNKIKAADLFTAAIDTTAEVLAYSGNAAADAGRAFISAVKDTVPAQTAVDSALAAIVNTPVVGSTQSFTTAVDSLVGTGGNDVFIADNTGTSLTATAGDSVNGGAGNDTIKLFVKSDADLTALALPQLTNVETLYVNGGVLTASKTADFSGLTGVTSVQVDSPATLANGSSTAIKTAATQSLSLTKVNSAAGSATVQINGATNVTLNAVGTDSVATGAVKLDLASNGAALTLNDTGAASKVTLVNSGAALATLSVTGDKNLTLTADTSLTALKTVNASAATGNVSLDVTALTLPASFAFTGGAGADTLTLKAGALGLLTAGSQLDGGAGTDTIVTSETSGLSQAQINTVNASKNFEVLGFAVDGSGVDVSKLTSINQFAVSKGSTVGAAFTNANSSSKFSADLGVDNGGTISIANAVGEAATNVTLSNTSGASHTLTNLTVTGISTVNLASTGVATKAGGANVVTTLSNSDNSKIVITGDTDLTITNKLAATAVGSKVDASAFTGKLSIIGSDKADVIIGGSGNDIIQGGTAANQADTLTGGAGADTFKFVGSNLANLLATSGNTTAITSITDFVAGTDKIALVNSGAAFTSITLSNTQTIASANDLTGVYGGISTIATSTSGGAASAALITVSSGAAAGTYLYVNDANAGVQAASDFLVKVAVTGTVTASDFVFA